MPLVGPQAPERVDATVFIPTYNGEGYLERLLRAVESQNFEGHFEILIIDSGSTDSTLDIISRHPLVRLVSIPKSEFGHGKTRNQAAQLARGEYVVYLSHDAVPVGASWLENLLLPLRSLAFGGNNAHAVFGKHIARTNCAPLMKYGIQEVFAQSGPDSSVTVVDGSVTPARLVTPHRMFYSDVCSASTRSFLLTKIPYQDLPYAEDLAFSKDLLAAGYRKAYQPSAVVEHSNDVTLREFGMRTFDEYLGMRRVGETRSAMSCVGAWARIARDVAVMSGRIGRDRDYSFGRKVYWLFVNPAYVVQKWMGARRALTVDLDDTAKIAKYSLEAHRG